MASYGKYRDTIVKGEKGTDWYVEIHKKDFSGTSTDMTLGGEGFEITWNGQGSTRDRIFLGSECVLSLMVRTDTDETDLYNILDAGFKEYFIRIYKGSTASANIWWYGWIQPSFDTIENAPYPYVSQITATDSYGYYEKQQFSIFSSEERKQDNHSLANIYLNYLHNTELAAVNLIEGPNFLDVSKWDIKSNDTISNGLLTINGQTGTRKPISCEGETLVVGETYTARVQVAYRTSGTLSLVDGGAGNPIGSINSNNPAFQEFTWTQTAASGGKGFHLYTDNGFVGGIASVSVYRTGDLPCPSGVDFMQTAIDWHTSVNSQDDALRSFICKGAFATNTNFPFEYKESDAFNEALKIFNTVGFLAEGKYNFIQPNHYIDTTTGGNTFYKYNSETTNPSSTTDTNLCEINQSTNALLGGSSFTYEAPFKSVSTVFTSIGSAFALGQADITDFGSNDDYVYGGQIIENQTYNLDWFSTYTETMPNTNLPSQTGDVGFLIYSGIQTFHSYITIKAVSTGVADKYLQINIANNELEWTTSEKRIVLSRGRVVNNPPTDSFSSPYSLKFNTGSSVGARSNPSKFSENDGDIIKFSEANNEYNFRGRLKFATQIPSLPNTSNIFVKIETNIDYTKHKPGGGGGYRSVTPTNTNLITKSSVSDEITLEVEETTSLSSNEARFTETSTSSTSTENFDLDDVSIGATESDATFAITDINNEPITSNFYRGSNSAGGEIVTQLLVKEFLEMQQSPLQILQGSIQSANISPLDIVKYKLNSDDAAAKYYMFLGGTFKANSEIMEGEWFRIKGD
mgnify:CR=1 FL=1|jgi:hypothetical protein